MLEHGGRNIRVNASVTPVEATTCIVDEYIYPAYPIEDRFDSAIYLSLVYNVELDDLNLLVS